MHSIVSIPRLHALVIVFIDEYFSLIPFVESEHLLATMFFRYSLPVTVIG